MNGKDFSCRVGLLLGLMLMVSLVDFYRHGVRASRPREYGFVLATGALGALFGCVNDMITSGISPEYFIFGKGLEQTPGLRQQAGLLGLRASFSAGVIGGALCLYAARRKSIHPPAELGRLLRLLWLPLLGAVMGGVALPCLLSGLDPVKFSSQLNGLLTADRINRFREVWWAHLGVYAGMVVGLGALIVFALKTRSCNEATRSAGKVPL